MSSGSKPLRISFLGMSRTMLSFHPFSSTGNYCGQSRGPKRFPLIPVIPFACHQVSCEEAVSQDEKALEPVEGISLVKRWVS